MSNTIVNSTTLTGWQLMLKLFPFFKEEIADWRLIPTSDVDTHLESEMDVVSVYSSVVVLAVLGVPGNLVLLGLSLHREIRTVSHSIYITAVSIVDTVCLCLTYANFLLRLKGGKMIYSQSDLHVCRFFYFVAAFFRMVSPWLRVAVSFDSFLTIIFPRLKRKLITPVNARAGLAVIVLLCLALQVPFAVAVDTLYFRGRDICALHDVNYVNLLPALNVVEAVAPCCVIVILNVVALIAITVRKTQSEKTEDEGEGRTNMDDKGQSSTAVVVWNLMAAIAMAPFIIVTTLLLDEFPRNIATTEYEQNLADAIPYTNVVYCVCLAANLYILLATSTLYRNVARRSLGFCKPTRST